MPGHKDVMLKLMDGLQVTGRNKELVAASRQFLVRYPTDPACADVERLLARLLAKASDTAGAAAVNEARWRRLGPTDEGRTAGIDGRCRSTYALNTADGFTKAATLADEMLDKLPAGRPTTFAGWLAFDCWERVNNWAKANLSAAGCSRKVPPSDKAHLRGLAPAHGRELRPHRPAHQRHRQLPQGHRSPAACRHRTPGSIGEIHASNPKPAAIEPVVAEFVQKFPTRDDRHACGRWWPWRTRRRRQGQGGANPRRGAALRRPLP